MLSQKAYRAGAYGASTQVRDGDDFRPMAQGGLRGRIPARSIGPAPPHRRLTEESASAEVGQLVGTGVHTLLAEAMLEQMNAVEPDDD